MTAPRPVWLLRGAAILALVASGVLVGDAIHPGRAFCPVEAACARARESEWGHILGMPTSVIGILAFGALFVLTLLPEAAARACARPAAWIGGAAGLAFVAYQAIFLGSFCPMCVVVDVSALLGAALAFLWRPAGRGRGGRSRPESLAERLRWACVAMLAIGVPVLWPRPEPPAWVPVPEVADLPPDVDVAPSPSATAETAPAPAGRPAPADAAPGPSAPPAPPPVASRPPEAAPPAPRAISIVEYLNPFCPHCRATHARFEKVLGEFRAPVSRRRVYVWASERPPAWAPCIACARAQGREAEFFEELTRTSRDDERSIFRAASRAGLDVDALRSCTDGETARSWVARERRVALAAGLKGLPTIDVGGRRLMGEQSEDDLREALEAARVP